MKTIQTSHMYLILRGVISFANAVMFTTYAVYYINALNLNPFQLLLIGTILELTIFLFENITGIVADTYSRRRSVLIGVFILGIAYIIEGSIPGLVTLLLGPFIWLAIAECIRGVGETFLSGAATAWVTDELSSDSIGRLFVRANQVSIISRILGAGASIGLAGLTLNLPYLIGGITFILLCIFLTFYMKETHFTPVEHEVGQSAIHSMLNTTKHSFRMLKGQPILLAIIGVSLFSGAASEGIDRLWEAHFLKTIHFPDFGDFSPVVWIGLISVSADLLTLLFSELYARLFDVNKERVLQTGLVVFSGLEIVGVTVFGLAQHVSLAIGCYLFIMVVRTLAGPLYDAWINTKIEARVRASVLSINSQSNALGQTLVGPMVGYIGSRYTIRAAILTSSFLLIPTFTVFSKVWMTSKKLMKKAS